MQYFVIKVSGVLRGISPLIPACHAEFKSCTALLSSDVQGEATKFLPIMHLFKAQEYTQEKKAASLQESCFHENPLPDEPINCSGSWPLQPAVPAA